MADLGNLWFSLGLDDSKFEKQWKQAFNKYRDQAKIKVDFKIDSNAIKELEKFKDAGFTSKQAKEYTKLATAVMKVAREQEKYNQELEKTKALQSKTANKDAESLKRQALMQERINDHIQRRSNLNKPVTQGYKTQSLWLQNLKTLTENYLSLYAVRNFVTELARVSGEFEKQKVTLQAMVGEMQGLEIYGKMKELAVVSPFEFKDLASYAKQLAAFSVPYEELYDTTKRLADVSAGLGVDMNRIVLAYGQIRSAGVLKGTELRQLTEAGFPIIERLAEKFTELEGKAVSVGDVFGKISKRLVSFDMVKDIFTELTSEGGKFYKMQEIQAETLAGKISNLKDAYSIMLSEIGESNASVLKDGVEWLYKLIDNWEAVGRTVFTVVAAYSALQGVKIIYWIAEQVTAFKSLISTIRQLKVEYGFLQAMTQGKGWGALAFTLVGIGTAIWQAVAASQKFNKELDEIFNRQNTKLDQEVRSLNELKTALDSAAEGSQNRREAINQFNNQFGSYLQNMLTETSTAKELAMAYNSVSEALKNKNKQEAKSKAEALVEEEYGSKLSSTMSTLLDGLKDRGLSSEEAKDVITLLREYYKQGGTKAVEIDKIIKDRIGEAAFNKAELTTPDLFRDKLKVYFREQVVEYETALKEAFEKIDIRFDASTYSTKGEADLVERVNKLYEDRVASLKAQKLEQEEYNKQLKEAEILKAQELAEGYGQLGLTEKAEGFIEQWMKLAEVTTGWRKDIADLAATFNDEDKGIKIPTVFNPKEDESWPQYVERLKKEYKELKDIIDNIGADPDKELPAYQAQLNVVQAIADAYKVQLDPKGTAKTKKEKEKERVNALKDEYNWLLKVYDAYKNYRKQEQSDSEAKQNVLADFSEMPEAFKSAFEGEHNIKQWFQSMMGVLAEEATKGGSDLGEALASAILQKLGVINTKEMIDALKLKQQLEDELTKWGMEDFALKGEGTTFEISKILRDQFIADNKVAANRNNLLKQTEALREQYGEEWYNSQVTRINELYNLEVAKNAKVAQEKIREMGESYAKAAIEESFSPDFFSNLGEKTFTQLKEATVKLKEMMANPSFLMDENYLDRIASGELSQTQVDEHIAQWEKYIKLFQTDTESQFTEKVKQDLQRALDAAKELVGALRGLSDNNVFQGVLDFAEMGLGVAESLAKGDFIGAGLQVVTGVINQITAAKKYREEMAKSADALTTSIAASRREVKIAGEEFNTIFGEDVLGALQADSEAISEITNELRGASKEVANMKIATNKGFFGMGIKQTTLKDLAPQLFKADGSVNYDYLDEFMEAYGDKLDDSQKTLLENLKTTYEQYTEAMADTTEYLKNIFSDTASTIAERMLESFALTGNAATELGDLVSGVAKQMAKDLIQSLLVDQYLTPAMDRIKALYNPQDKAYEDNSVLRTQKAIIAMQEAINAAGQAVPEVNKLLESIEAMGVDLNADSENASQVLSGLTEDQQNLLVSYINAIRADVSMNKGILTSIMNSVGTINNNIATAIVVWTQIEANTHRSADGVDKIIGFFESVMGPYDGGGGQAFKVNIA